MRRAAVHKATLSIQEDVPLAPKTTIGLGGEARHFAECTTPAQIRDALAFAADRHLQVHILGGGSNVIFGDDGFPGLVIRIALRGISVIEGDPCAVTAAAGEEWDSFVGFCIDYNLGGLECLSGIPGLVGATPIQNVGAYGQEVSETIKYVRAMDRASFETLDIPAPNCWFGYRKSRFKVEDSGRYVVLAVTFGLRKNALPVVRYAELQQALEAQGVELAPGPDGLLTLRNAVLGLRRRKSMVVDPADPHSRSVGSFFVNPVLSPEAFAALQQICAAAGMTDPIPSFAAAVGTKVPAAWLVEHAGFPRGLRRGGVGISDNHSLALVNYGGTSRELLELATDIQRAVRERFGITLVPEPVIVPPIPLPSLSAS